jgi:aerobic-type carbon monoxide dehydrogenase small subunit (CoxS/CutS family)
MSEEDRKKEKKEKGEISRREFLKDAGFVVGGAAVGAAIAWPLIPGEETIVEVPGETVFVDVPGPTVTVEVPGPTVTVPGPTVTVPGPTVTVTVEVPGEKIPGAITLTINGESRLVKVEPEWSLAFVLKEKLGLTGTKIGCDRAECGTCTVIVDGRTALACSILAVQAEGLDITTIEGLADGYTLHPVQQLFWDADAFQCGYCTPGMIMSAKALIDRTPNPTVDEAREAISGNLCYCSDYPRIVAAIAGVSTNVEVITDPGGA